VKIAVIGEFDPAFPPHAATTTACSHSARALNLDVDPVWISAADVSPAVIRNFAGIWVAPGSPYKSLDNAVAAIRYAREKQLPCFGTCGGFQHMIIEYARNVLGFEDAQHAEYDPYASDLFVTQLDCSLVGRELELHFKPGSLVSAIYGSTSAVERYYCNFGVDPDKVALLSSKDLQITGSDLEGAVRVIELPGHPFFLGTLFVPQLRSTSEKPHPLVSAFVAACAHRASADEADHQEYPVIKS
jgi:CTP synthase (UTP-ammonia lyase)